MKVLGRGWQYTAYDLGNGRVLKKYNSKLVGYAIIFRDALWWGWPPVYEVPERYRVCKGLAAASLDAVSKGILEPWMMANPSIKGELSYEQDKVTPLGLYLRKSSDSEICKVIDNFIALNKHMIERGVIDKSFKIGANFGLDTQGRVVLMDLGELYLDPEAIAQRRRDKPWADRWERHMFPNDKTYTYYVEQMDKYIGLGIPVPEEM
ncbi:MAG TPA: hypothetical protein VIY48_21505 [Candidatus Paceibacterota bacterium]